MRAGAAHIAANFWGLEVGWAMQVLNWATSLAKYLSARGWSLAAAKAAKAARANDFIVLV